MDHKKALFIICAVAFLLRIALALQANTYAPEAYRTIREVEHIKDTGLPIFKDELSYGGRTSITLPVFPYLIAFSTLFTGDLAYLIVPNLLAVLLHIAIFALSLELTNDTKLSLLAAAASIFIPAYIHETLITLNSLSLAIPLTIACVTLYLKLRKSKEKRNTLLFLFIILSFTHPIAAVFVPFFILSTALNTIKQAKGEIAQQEFAVFGTFYLVWLNIILYKHSFAAGWNVFRANIPLAAQSSVYGVDLLTLTAAIGIVPVTLALYAAYKEAGTQHIGILVTLSLAITTSILTAAKLISAASGTALLAATCIPLAAVGMQRLLQYSKRLRRKTLPSAGLSVLALIFLATSALPSMLSAAVAIGSATDPSIIRAATWLEENSVKNRLIITEPEWGYIIETVAKRPVYLDQDYMNQQDAQRRYDVTTEILADVGVEKLVNEEHIDYIVSKERISANCVNTVYTDEVYIARVLCE